MPRLMSFSKTIDQIRNQTKTVTRRLGWKFLQAGDVLWAVEKAMGLKRGEKVQKICKIRVVDVRRERLNALELEAETVECRRCNGLGLSVVIFTNGPALPCRWCHEGQVDAEASREGFHGMSNPEFVDFFCDAMDCTPQTEITRIEFEYVEEGKVTG